MKYVVVFLRGTFFVVMLGICFGLIYYEISLFIEAYYNSHDDILNNYCYLIKALLNFSGICICVCLGIKGYLLGLNRDGIIDITIISIFYLPIILFCLFGSLSLLGCLLCILVGAVTGIVIHFPEPDIIFNIVKIIFIILYILFHIFGVIFELE